jgi:hypothetical protein
VFIGHPGVALANKAAAPRIGLGMLFIAAMWLDLIRPAFPLLGIETVGIDPADAPGSTTGNRRRDTRETRICPARHRVETPRPYGRIGPTPRRRDDEHGGGGVRRRRRDDPRPPRGTIRQGTGSEGGARPVGLAH